MGLCPQHYTGWGLVSSVGFMGGLAAIDRRYRIGQSLVLSKIPRASPPATAYLVGRGRRDRPPEFRADGP